MDNIEIINIRLSSELLKKVDELIREGSYSSRSEVIRELCRNYVLEERYKDE
ncbi:MAG: ribbon-helix-helix domain-containing protein [Candidatus Woesearchaeota archaeon]